MKNDPNNNFSTIDCPSVNHFFQESQRREKTNRSTHKEKESQNPICSSS